VAPAGTPRAVVAKLHDAINEGLRSPELRGHLAKLGAETKVESAEDFAKLLADETRKWAEVIKSSGATIN
jgi:tripartite-type tricarboxylate transporter receptor subunit TctC